MKAHAFRASLAFVATLFVVSAGSAEPRRFPLPPEEWPETIDDQPTVTFLMLDRLEYRTDEKTDARVWDAQGWVGGDWNKFWFKTDGVDIVGDDIEKAEFQALYARLIAPFWVLQAGLRHDADPTPTRNFAVVGVQGLAPLRFDVEATAFLSEDGDLSARLEAEYDLLLTQRLILQPRFETNFAASEVEALGIGRGFNDIELDLRLRYEIRREFAPYIGVSWQRALGDTADFARAEGEEVESAAFLLGLRAWY